jgi:prepilin-type N-terminal cleavage/methylation domain-containing protein
MQQHWVGETRRHGITLLEILLVVAIVALIASLAMPNLLRTFAAHTIDKSADIVRSEMGRARVKAIRSGKIYAFVYNLGQSQMAVRPFDALVQAGSIDHFTSTGTADRRSSHLDYSGENLPRGIRFAAGSAVADVRSEYVTEEVGGTSGKMTPILFYPDGSSQNAKIVLTNEAGDAVQIILRGLTGSARVARLDSR